MKEVEKKYRPVPFWSWNDTLDKDELVRQVEWMDSHGIGGFFMHARGGLKTEYLGKEWFECIDACAKRAQELGMEAYAYDENGWPSGFAGGKLLEDVENRDMYLTHTYGEYDPEAYVSYEISTKSLKMAKKGDKNCFNIYKHHSTSTADILNPEVVDKFINLTHEEYKKRDNYSLKGFFTDEPQYYRWGMPFTKMLPEYFSRVYGEDIRKGLGLMFLEKRGYRAFRYKFWKALQELMLENFGKKIYDWCDKNGYNLTGHYIDETCLCGQLLCCAGVMPFYEYEHIPGIDYLGIRITEELGAKQVDSVAAQLGKKQILTETFAGCGWNISPIELKKIAESQYVAGVNLLCHHLLPYHEQGQRKRDYPAHFSSINPWVEKGFSTFNGYFSYLGKLIANSDELVNVGVLHPVRSGYFDYKYELYQNGTPYSGIEYLERPFYALMTELCNKGIGHHYLDETLLKKYGSVNGDKLTLGKCTYDYVIVPEILTMDVSTEKILRKYVENGGKILMWGKKPTYLEGKRFTYKYLRSNTTIEEIIKAQPYSIKQEKGCDVRCAYRREENGQELIYAVNLGKATTVDFSLPKGAYLEGYDILTDSYFPMDTRVSFDDGQSYIMYIREKMCCVAPPKKDLTLEGEFKIKETVDNYLTLDMISYSLDGVSYTAPRHHMCVQNELLDIKHKGKVYLKYTAEIESVPTKCSLLMENTRIGSVYVNGKLVKDEGNSPLELAELSYNVASYLVKGKNEFVAEIDYFQGENVYYALFGENVTESLKNCLAYDTDIEAAYLVGDFGVYGSFSRQGQIFKGEGFTVGEQKKEATSLVTEGFPFFSGDITLIKEIELESTDYCLYIPQRFHMISVVVNGENAGDMMFSRRLDISKYLKAGKNTVELTVSVGRRNLLGPFHTHSEYDFVGPDTFERFGSWKDGKSPHFSEKYLFVNVI